MLIQFENYLTFENIYLWTNFCILPFWFAIIVGPNSKFTQFFVNSVVLPLFLGVTYIYVIYQIILLDESLFELFKIYLSLDSLYTVFETESFLLIFWLHFISLNLFLGSWVGRDAFKHNMHRGVVLIPLLLIYFSGPVGLVSYWIVRVFYAKKLGFHD